MDVRRRSGRKGRQRLRRIWAVLAAIAVAMPTVAALATPVAAQAQYLEVRKTASPTSRDPGRRSPTATRAKARSRPASTPGPPAVRPAERGGSAPADAPPNRG